MEALTMYLATQAQFFTAHQAREVEVLLAERRGLLEEGNEWYATQVVDSLWVAASPGRRIRLGKRYGGKP